MVLGLALFMEGLKYGLMPLGESVGIAMGAGGQRWPQPASLSTPVPPVPRLHSIHAPLALTPLCGAPGSLQAAGLLLLLLQVRSTCQGPDADAGDGIGLPATTAAAATELVCAIEKA